MAYEPLSSISKITRLTGNENIVLTQGNTQTGNGRYSLEQLKKELGNKSLLGSVTPLTKDIEQGVYIASEVGVYPNFGNIEVTQADFDNGLVLLTKNNDGTFTKDLVPMPGVVLESQINVDGGVTGFNPIGKVAEGDSRAVSGGEVFNYANQTVDSNSITINRGKEYPMIGLPTSDILKPKVELLNNILLDAEISIYEKNTPYFIGGFYKDNTTQGSGFILSRLYNGVAGGAFLTTLGSNAASIDNRDELVSKFSAGGIQRFDLKVSAWNLDISLTIDIDAISSSYVAIAYQDYPNWLGSNFASNVFLPFDFNYSPDSIPSFNTFKDALKLRHKGVFRVGNVLAKNKVNNIIYNGDNENFKPSNVTSQYDILNGGIKNNMSVEGKLIKVEKYNSTDNANIKWVSRTKMYFIENPQNSFVIADNYVGGLIVNKNTNNYKLVTLPTKFSDAEFNNQIMNVIELPCGELLIENRAGAEGTAGNYQTREVLVYKTIDFKNKSFISNELTLLESDLKLVTKYPSGTTTRQGWSWSIYQNNILIAPYGSGRTGVLLFSNDNGDNFTCIFNMGVSGFPVKLNNNLDTAYPIPSNVIPAQPADMWTRGGGNAHIHGALYDQYFDRIWVFSGDNQDPKGRSDTWYTDDFGENYHKLEMRTPGTVDSINGFQALNGISHPDYILLGSDSFTNGFVRYSRGKKDETPVFESVFWRNDTYSQTLDCLCGGIDLDDNGQVVAIFHPNLDYEKKGFVVRSADGLKFDQIYQDEYSDGTQAGTKFGWTVDIKKSIDGSYLIVVPSGNGGGLIKL